MFVVVKKLKMNKKMVKIKENSFAEKKVFLIKIG